VRSAPLARERAAFFKEFRPARCGCVGRVARSAGSKFSETRQRAHERQY
jgi:hypothetical protein